MKDALRDRSDTGKSAWPVGIVMIGAVALAVLGSWSIANVPNSTVGCYIGASSNLAPLLREAPVDTSFAITRVAHALSLAAAPAAPGARDVGAGCPCVVSIEGSAAAHRKREG